MQFHCCGDVSFSLASTMMSRQNTESSEVCKRARFLHFLISSEVDHHDLIAITLVEVREVEGGLGQEEPLRMRQAVGGVQGTVHSNCILIHICNF